MYEIIYCIDYAIAEDMDGNCEYDTTTCRETFNGSHIQLLNYIKEMRSRGCYDIEAYATCEADDYDY